MVHLFGNGILLCRNEDICANKETYGKSNKTTTMSHNILHLSHIAGDKTNVGV